MKSHGQLVVNERRRISFKSVAPSKLIIIQWKTIYPRIYEHHKFDLIAFLFLSFFKKISSHNWVGKKVRVVLGGFGEEMNMIKIHCKKSLKS